LQRPLIVLVGLTGELPAAIEAAAQGHGVCVENVETFGGQPQLVGPRTSIVAGLLPSRAGEQAEKAGRAEQTSQLRRALRCAPLVALVDRADMPTRGLAARGFHAAVDSAAPAPVLAERAVRAALAARRAVDLDLVGGSPAMARLREDILLAASVPSHALLLGETGTGKGVAARALHARSDRRNEPFETVDCTALSPSLIESELFGHERGAFTGAHERRRGRLERAATGTLFLDEIGELALPLQAKLLRALEERQFERLGGREPLHFRARVVAATHRDLEAEVRARRFRQDLFYRLDVLRLYVPPLRDRLEDLPVLVDHLLQRAARRLERKPPRAGAKLLEQLRARQWPGNVRELANHLEAMTVRAGRGESLAALPLLVAEPGGSPPALSPSEHAQLAELLRDCGGNVARVARRLGRPRSTVRYRIARHGLSHLIPRD